MCCYITNKQILPQFPFTFSTPIFELRTVLSFPEVINIKHTDPPWTLLKRDIRGLRCCFSKFLTSYTCV